MKKIVLVLFVGLLGFSLTAQDTAAKIEFKSETVDYGEIAKGSDGVRVFEFTNTGTAPLIVSKVSSSCGCTIPKNRKTQFYQVKQVKFKLSMILTELDLFVKRLR